MFPLKFKLKWIKIRKLDKGRLSEFSSKNKKGKRKKDTIRT